MIEYHDFNYLTAMDLHHDQLNHQHLCHQHNQHYETKHMNIIIISSSVATEALCHHQHYNCHQHHDIKHMSVIIFIIISSNSSTLSSSTL